MDMAVIPTQLPPQPSPDWFKTINAINVRALSHHQVIPNATPHPNYYQIDTGGVSTKEHLIQGEMITVHQVYSDLDYLELESKYQMQLPNFIKVQLMTSLVEELKKHNSISFTSQIDSASGDRYFRARIFATPNDQVRIVKELLYKNNTT